MSLLKSTSKSKNHGNLCRHSLCGVFAGRHAYKLNTHNALGLEKRNMAGNRTKNGLLVCVRVGKSTRPENSMLEVRFPGW